MGLSHEELCERARRWLSGTRRCEPVFSNIASCREIPDAIGWSSAWKWRGSTVVECKTSRSDFMSDRHKYILYRHPDDKRELSYFDFRQWAGRPTGKHAEELGYVRCDLPRMGDFRYFMCEPDVIGQDLVEQHAPDHGLIWVTGQRRVEIVRPALRRTELVDKDGEIRYLRFAIINRKHPFAPDSATIQNAEAMQLQ